MLFKVTSPNLGSDGISILSSNSIQRFDAPSLSTCGQHLCEDELLEWCWKSLTFWCSVLSDEKDSFVMLMLRNTAGDSFSLRTEIINRIRIALTQQIACTTHEEISKIDNE